LIKDIEMTTEELKEMYAEYCMEGGFQISPEGFAEFVEWRKDVEKYFRFTEDQGG
jgi:hypothetical protein